LEKFRFEKYSNFNYSAQKMIQKSSNLKKPSLLRKHRKGRHPKTEQKTKKTAPKKQKAGRKTNRNRRN
jgi:hypothetical protein